MVSKVKTIIIAAVSENNIIGQNGTTPWHSKEELTHFKKTTIHYPVLMGRKTFTSLNKSLNDRTNLVLSRNSNFHISEYNVFSFTSIGEVYDFSKKNNFTKLFVIGGGEIYSQMIDQADELLISRMKFTIQGDTYFPKIDELIWELKSKEKFKDFILEKYIRK